MGAFWSWSLDGDHPALSVRVRNLPSGSTSIVVTTLQKLDAVSVDEVDAAVLLGDPARPDP
jgi:hypothetical protein